MSITNDYYVYIDPRNYEEFYYGKAKGSRKDAHLSDGADIAAIHKESLEPIIRVISAGQGLRWRDAMLGFHEGDIVAAYLKGRGFVGIGQLTSRAKPIREVTIKGKPLLRYKLRCSGVDDNVDSNELCEYVATVRWIQAADRSHAKWKRKSGIYTTTHVRASLDAQPKTIAFLEDAFGVNLREYVR